MRLFSLQSNGNNNKKCGTVDYSFSMVKTVDEKKYPQCKQTRIVWVTLSILLLSKLTAPLLQSFLRPHWGHGVGTLLQQRMSRLSVCSATIFKNLFTSTGFRLWRKSSIFFLRDNLVKNAWGDPKYNRKCSLVERALTPSEQRFLPPGHTCAIVRCCRPGFPVPWWGWPWQAGIRALPNS